jgi:hypothetical protein
MREDGSDAESTVVPTEYGPLVLARAVTFDEEPDRAVRPSRRKAEVRRKRRGGAAPA